MRLLRLPRAGLLAAWALLAGLGLMTLEGYLHHTDDGCTVETHCVVCSVHLGTTVLVAAAPALPQQFSPTGFVVREAEAWTPEFAAPASASRGPPLV